MQSPLHPAPGSTSIQLYNRCMYMHLRITQKELTPFYLPDAIVLLPLLASTYTLITVPCENRYAYVIMVAYGIDIT